MSRDFQSAFELYVEGNNNCRRLRTRNIAVFPNENEISKESLGNYVNASATKVSNNSHGHPRPCSTSEVNRPLKKKIPTIRKLFDKSDISTSCFKLGYQLIRKSFQSQKFGELSISSGIHQKDANFECLDSFAKVGATDALDYVNENTVMHESGLSPTYETDRREDDLKSQLMPKSRLVVKITKKKFCQLTCIGMDSSVCDRGELQTAYTDCNRWLRANRLRHKGKSKIASDANCPDEELHKELFSTESLQPCRDFESNFTKDCSTSSEDKQHETSNNFIAFRTQGENEESATIGFLVKQRPRRHVISNKLSDDFGLSWREEKDLKRALYASLQKRRSIKTEIKEGNARHVNSSSACDGLLQSQARDCFVKLEHKAAAAECSDSCISQHSLIQDNNGWAGDVPLGGNDATQLANCSTEFWINCSCHWNEGDCPLHKEICTPWKYNPQTQGQNQVRAQRKFAQCSRPNTPTLTLCRKISHNGPSKDPKRKTVATEDFLTFLCLRGTDLLPPHLKFFNNSESESMLNFPSTSQESPDVNQPDIFTTEDPSDFLQRQGASVADSEASVMSSELQSVSKSSLHQSLGNLEETSGLKALHTALESTSSIADSELEKSEIPAKRRKVSQRISFKTNSSVVSANIRLPQNERPTLSEDDHIAKSAVAGKECVLKCNSNVVYEKRMPVVNDRKQLIPVSAELETRNRPTTRSHTIAMMKKRASVDQFCCGKQPEREGK